MALFGEHTTLFSGRRTASGSLRVVRVVGVRVSHGTAPISTTDSGEIACRSSDERAWYGGQHRGGPADPPAPGPAATQLRDSRIGWRGTVVRLSPDAIFVSPHRIGAPRCELEAANAIPVAVSMTSFRLRTGAPFFRFDGGDGHGSRRIEPIPSGAGRRDGTLFERRARGCDRADRAASRRKCSWRCGMSWTTGSSCSCIRARSRPQRGDRKSYGPDRAPTYQSQGSTRATFGRCSTPRQRSRPRSTLHARRVHYAREPRAAGHIPRQVGPCEFNDSRGDDPLPSSPSEGGGEDYNTAGFKRRYPRLLFDP